MKELMLFTRLSSSVSSSIPALLGREGMDVLRRLFSGPALKVCGARSLRHSARLVAMLFLFGFGWQSAWAATFYVDPVAGNDANPGTSQTAAWKTIPGTRTSSNSGFVSSSWGPISCL